MKTKLYLLLFISIFSYSYSASSQIDPFLGQVTMFAGNFAPRGWAFCEGQLLPINQNQALFSLLGTTYGGDGRTTFGLPDLRGRTAVGVGNGPGLPTVNQGSQFGTATTTLSINNLPAHSHSVNGVTEVGTSSDPTGNYPANTKIFDNEYGTGTLTPMNSGMIAPSGQGQAFENRPPSLGIRYIIALVGIFPSRS